MHEVSLFVEDYAHQHVVGALVHRIADECQVPVRLAWRSAVRGHGRVVRELNSYLHNLVDQGGPIPDLIVVATDANCRGLSERTREIGNLEAPARIVLAIPDPHIERWLLLDGRAFRAVFGTGCDAPDRKCDRDRYKHRLAEAVHATGTIPAFGGIEFSDDIVIHMDIDRSARADRSFRRFIYDLRSAFRGLAQQ